MTPKSSRGVVRKVESFGANNEVTACSDKNNTRA
jgi:hypothetical protein